MFGRRNAAPDNRPVCRFWKQGNCRFGRDCKFKHEDDAGPSGFNTNNSNNNPPNNFRNNNKINKHNPFLLDKDAIRADLTAGEEKPSWPLSAYGPGRDAPQELLDSKYEVSPEEMRVQCYLSRINGQLEQYVNQEQRLSQEIGAEQAKILGNIDDAIKFVQDGESRVDNRCAQVSKGVGEFPRGGQAFGQPSQTAPPSGMSTFGQTSHDNQNPAFPSRLGSQGAFQQQQQSGLGGSPSFGQPTAIGSSAFGRPSQPALGQPSQPGQSTFGQQSQQSQSTFGQGSQQSQSTFGQPSAFGQQSQPAGSTFGQPSSFGQASQQAPSTFGMQSQQNQSSFGQPSQHPRPTFGQPSQQQPSPFGQPSQQPSPFGAANTQGQQTNVFTFGKPSAPSGAPPTQPQPPAQRPTSDNHPGPDPDAEGPPSAYEGELGKALKDVYQAVAETGRFGDVIPEIPPKREWINFPEVKSK